jgi:hypothetical protein
MPQIETSKTEGTRYNWTPSELKLGREIERMEDEAAALRKDRDEARGDLGQISAMLSRFDCPPVQAVEALMNERGR